MSYERRVEENGSVIAIDGMYDHRRTTSSSLAKRSRSLSNIHDSAKDGCADLRRRGEVTAYCGGALAEGAGVSGDLLHYTSLDEGYIELPDLGGDSRNPSNGIRNWKP